MMQKALVFRSRLCYAGRHVRIDAAPDPREPTPVLRCGRRVFTTGRVAEIQGLLTAHPDWPRAHVAVALCRAWDWRHPDGTLKQQTCQALLAWSGAGWKTAPRDR